MMGLLSRRLMTVCVSKWRNYCTNNEKRGVVVGVYNNNNNNTHYTLTDAATTVNNNTSGNFMKLLQYGGTLKPGKCRVLFGASDDEPIIGVVGLGTKHQRASQQQQDPLEERDAAKEAVRVAVAAGVRGLTDVGVDSVHVDVCGDGEAAAEGAHLASFIYQDLKTKKKPVPTITCLDHNDEGWSRGMVLAEGQNIARRLMETPANILTPTNFAQEAVNYLEGLKVEVLTRGYEWAAERGMNAFLSVTKGSDQPPVFLELTYRGAGFSQQQQQPLAIVGKGVTFDSGGISLKPASNMDKMRADMGGAACTVGAIYAAAKLGLPINIKGFIPLCENMPGNGATKPGDVVTASNGKTIQVDNTDAEGRLILADALHYASQHKPRIIIDLATLTGAMAVSLGSGATGVFSNSNVLWESLQHMGNITGDRVWRMPLWKHYSAQVNEFGLADVNNIGKYSRDGGSCTAAAFLREFVNCDHWAHLDIAGVMENKDEVPYLGKGMSGRPTRTLVKLIHLLAQPDAPL